MASIQNVLRTFKTTYKFDVLLLKGAAEPEGQKTHKISPSLAAAGPVFQPNQLYQKVLHNLELSFWENCFIIKCFPMLSEKEIKQVIGGLDLDSLQLKMADN